MTYFFEPTNINTKEKIFEIAQNQINNLAEVDKKTEREIQAIEVVQYAIDQEFDYYLADVMATAITDKNYYYMDGVFYTEVDYLFNPLVMSNYQTIASTKLELQQILNNPKHTWKGSQEMINKAYSFFDDYPGGIIVFE